MILGTPQSARSVRTSPFTRPEAAAGAYVPKLPHTGFYSHIHPLHMVTHAMRAMTGYRPPLVPSMGPHGMPNVPAVAAAAPAAPAVAPPVPTPGGTGGFGGAGFGSTGGTQMHMAVDPYRVMRGGFIPGVRNNGSNIRAGVTNASARVHSGFPYQTAPLPPPPPPPMPVAAMPAVPATGLKGFMGALSDHLGFGGRPRHRPGFWFQHMMAAQPMGPAASSCERIGPRSDGLFVKICDGRVTEVSDAAGNVRQNPFA